MYLEVLEAGEALVAGGAAVRLLVGVGANVDEHLVPADTRYGWIVSNVATPGLSCQTPGVPLSHLALKPLPFRAQPSQWQQYPESFSGLTWKSLT